MKFLWYILFIISLNINLLKAENTGSDKDFEGAETAVPKEQIKTLDNIKFIENYADYSEFQEGQNAEETEAEAFFHMGRMFGISLDLGIGAFTKGYSQLNDYAMRFGIKGTYFFSLTMALEVSLHYQKHPFFIPYSGINGWDGTNKLITGGIGAKYYIDTRNWSDIISWLNPHLYAGIESITITTEAYYSPSSPPESIPNSYTINERIWALALGGGAEIQLSSMTYLGATFKYHYGTFPEEGTYQYGSEFTGDTYSLDLSIIFYY